MPDLTVEQAIEQANAHIARLNAQQSVTFDNPDDEEDEDEDEVLDVTRANAEDGERPE